MENDSNISSSMRPVIVIADFLNPNWTPLAHENSCPAGILTPRDKVPSVGAEGGRACLKRADSVPSRAAMIPACRGK